MKLYFNAPRRTARIKNIDLDFFEIELGESLYRICPCHDADFFSDEVLRLLLLSDGGKEVELAAAISMTDTLTVKLVSLN